ncbi:hypothetical protein Tco_1214615 [Tanacetum coccineum]
MELLIVDGFKAHDREQLTLLTFKTLMVALLPLEVVKAILLATKDKIDAGDSEKEDESVQDCFELPIWHSILPQTHLKKRKLLEDVEVSGRILEQRNEELGTQAETAKSSSTNIFSTVSTTAKASGTNLVNTVSIPVSTASANKGLSLSDTTNS